MNTQLKSALTFAAAMLVAGAVHAHDCSGGVGGGMDATGNDCGMVDDVVMNNEAPAAAVHHSAVTGAAKATPSNRTVAMNRTGHAKHHSHVHHVSASKSRTQS